MTKKEEFKHFMLCGHGRCFSLLKDNEEEFRDIVLYGCLNDISYDMQCEGSRGLFMYNLALEYNDYDYFLRPAIEKFLSSTVNDDWHTINHLGDFIDLFAYDYGEKSAENAIEAKYAELYGLIMTLRWSAKANEILQSYEYVSIMIMQNGDFDRTLRIFSDMGAFFLRRRRADDCDLKWRFAWFFGLAKEKYGEEHTAEQLEILSADSKEIRRFRRVMSAESESSRSQIEKPTADDYIKNAESGKIMLRNKVAMRRADDSEKIKLAQAAIAETNPDIKAKLLYAFTISSNVFPLDPAYLVELVRSENMELRETALNALSYIQAECVHDLAVELMEGGNSADALELLIRNYTENDRELLMKHLLSLEIDRENRSGWHSAVMSITDSKVIGKMPDEAIMFVYERSMCSCCRGDAVEELIKRGLLTDELLTECLWDCNSDIREIATENNKR